MLEIDDLCTKFKSALNLQNVKSEEYYIGLIKRKLTDCNIDYDKFCEFLITHNAFLSGSFLLQIIQNEFYPENKSDIDIYTFSEKSEELEKELHNIIYKSIYNTLEQIQEQHPELKVNTPKNFSSRKHDYICEFLIDTKDSKAVNRSVLYKKEQKEMKYNGIDSVIQSEFKFYKSDFINEIVDFNIDNGKKFQLIYCDNIRTIESIINDFDMDFCANYFDGKKLYVKNWDSIINRRTVRKFDNYRIYRSELERIPKYMNRGFDIKICFAEDIYTVAVVNKQSQDPLPEVENLVMIMNIDKTQANCDDFTEIFLNVPQTVKKLIVYSYPRNTLIDNLPVCLTEFRIFDWYTYLGSGALEKNLKQAIDERKVKKIKAYQDEKKKRIEDGRKYIMSCLNKQIKKIPFGCSVYLNDEKIFT
jgi:hypothetical protein